MTLTEKILIALAVIMSLGIVGYGMFNAHAETLVSVLSTPSQVHLNSKDPMITCNIFDYALSQAEPIQKINWDNIVNDSEIVQRSI